MKNLSLFLIICALLSGCILDWPYNDPSEKIVPLEKSEKCAACHPSIFKEWKESFHALSSAHKDKSHSAVHQAFVKSMTDQGKKGNYHCANCHAPMADNLKDLMSGKAELDSDNWTHTEGIGCTFCHRVESVVEQEKFNTYELNKDGVYYSGGPANKKSPHKTAKSQLFTNGQICMGCHSHKISSKNVSICSMNEEGENNCLSCHMPPVQGSPAVGSEKATHFSHTIAGGHDVKMLRKAVTLDVKIESTSTTKSLLIYVTNIINHNFPSTNPMRMAFVKVTAKDALGNKVWENFKDSPLEDKTALFFKAFKAGDTVGVPSWKAEEIAFDTRLKAGKTRRMSYSLDNPAIKEVTVELFYLLFPPSAIKGFGIPQDGVNEKHTSVIKKTITL